MFIEFPDRRQSTGIVRDPEVLASAGVDGIMVLKVTIELTRDRIYTGRPEKAFPWLVRSLEEVRAGSGPLREVTDYYPSDILLRRKR
ncbi:hypothetical protein GVN21_02030 [Caulobacter sp. SLTY]|uniref:hypothetical protein n=1 Tax=Caulobacter sp. SLTY TaxID=2683262 RepID=UPI0014137124|nr:hypothetical protein [Caulobacter sp. SLTY]NBB14132.1 hypothetical protein [Caulobacter sp. SLTY]